MTTEVDALLRKLIRQSNSIVNPCEQFVEPLRNYLFDLQLEILNDPADFKILEAGRRASKTTLMSVALTLPALAEPGIDTLYFALTKSSAQGILWEPLIDLLDQFNVPYTSNSIDGVIRLANKSRIVFAGAPTKRDCEKLRGRKFKRICGDEIGAFPEHIRYLLSEVLFPTMADYAGSQIYLAGTTNASCTGFFHEICNGTGSDKKWKKWHFDLRDNPALPRWAKKKDWKKQANIYFAKLRKQYESEGKLNQFLREFEAKWVKDLEALLFPQLYTTNDIPTALDHYIGIDLGFNPDPIAIVIIGIEQAALPKAYLLESFQETEVLTSDLARIIKNLNEKYSPLCMAMDPGAGGTRTIADINAMYGLNIENAQKPHGRKHLDIELLSDLARSKRFLISDGATEAFSELSRIQWNEKRQPDPRFMDHILDATIYSFRTWMQYFSENPQKEDIDLVNDFDKADYPKAYAEYLQQQAYERDLLFGELDY